jgi:hypothetical protein
LDSVLPSAGQLTPRLSVPCRRKSCGEEPYGDHQRHGHRHTRDTGDDRSWNGWADRHDRTEPAGPKVDVVFDVTGDMRVPNDYLTTSQFLRSWTVASDPGQGSKELHVVYPSPGTVAAYCDDGRFPDGAALVNVVFETTALPGNQPPDTLTKARSHCASTRFCLGRCAVIDLDLKRPLGRRNDKGCEVPEECGETICGHSSGPGKVVVDSQRVHASE